jgi:hypothetical protein
MKKADPEIIGLSYPVIRVSPGKLNTEVVRLFFRN